MRRSVVVCVLVSVLSIMAVGFGQQLGPRFMDRSFHRPGARALGMGGAYLLATDDATAVAWNPAALVNVKRFTLPVEIVGRTNFDVRDIQDLVDDLETIRDQTDVDDLQQVIAAIQNAFTRVQNFARSRPTLRASLLPFGGLSFGNFALTANSEAIVQVDTWVDTNSDPIGVSGGAPLPTPNLYFRGGAIALTSVGIANAHSLPAGLTLGITVRYVRADFAGFFGGATTNNIFARDPVIGQDFDRVDEAKFTFDIGAIWEPPVQPPMWRIRYAAVVRNVLPMKFNLPATSNGIPRPGFDFSFRLNPEIDLGVLAAWKERTIGVLELHNVTQTNGGKRTIHVGVEHLLGGDVFAVRVGYDDDKPVLGLGINFKLLRIDLASGLRPKERAAIGISFRF